MKTLIRTILVCCLLVGGTAFFAYHLLGQFNKTLDDISASSFAIAKISPVILSDKTSKEQLPTSTPETISTSTVATSTVTTSTDLKLSFIFPKKNNEVYIGCTYQLFFQSSTTIRSLETTLIDAGTIETIEPTTSGLARENKIELNSQSLDWKVGEVLLGEYYIRVSSINGVDLENYSKVFKISKMPKGISANEKEKVCKESDGSFMK